MMACECPCRVMGRRLTHGCTSIRDYGPRIECHFPSSGNMVAIHPCASCRKANLRVIVCGSRSIGEGDYDRVRWILDHEMHELAARFDGVSPIIVWGGAKGIDSMAYRWAQEHGHMSEKHYPDYKRYGRRKAPHVRNQEMVDLGAHLVIGIIKGNSGGTRSCLDKARKAEYEVHEHEWTD